MGNQQAEGEIEQLPINKVKPEEKNRELKETDYLKLAHEIKIIRNLDNESIEYSNKILKINAYNFW
jgi:hypothetical protein